MTEICPVGDIRIPEFVVSCQLLRPPYFHSVATYYTSRNGRVRPIAHVGHADVTFGISAKFHLGERVDCVRRAIPEVPGARFQDH